ncbi:MAG: hypothetical protein D4R74_13430 [Betaproteobacteria bacterium]|nr:MAG: hypothetical protein D4R74_13430 [Betaproteobacteria bacterium]
MRQRRPVSSDVGRGAPRRALRRFSSLLLGLGLSTAHAPARALESVLAFGNPAEAASGGTGVSATLHYFIGNDPLSARQYQDDWRGDYHPRKGLNLGLLSARAEAGLQTAGWRLSALRRTELLIESNRDMTDLMRLYKTREAFAAGQRYDVDLNYAGFEAKGWRLDKAWNWKTAGGHDFSVGAGYSLLEGNRVRAGTAQGSFASLGGGNYGYAVRMDDAYSGKAYPFQTPGTPEGKGGSVDLGMEWKTPQGARVEAVANDLLGRMRWRDVPGTVANAGTGVTSTDANGYIVYAPALSGRNARRDFTQKLPPRWGVGAEMPWRDFYVLGSLSHQQHATFPLLALGWKFAEGWRIQADYDLRFNTYGFRLAGSRAFLALRASQRNLDEARAYGLTAGASWMF